MTDNLDTLVTEALARIRDGRGDPRTEADAALRARHYGIGNDPNPALYANFPYAHYAGDRPIPNPYPGIPCDVTAWVRVDADGTVAAVYQSLEGFRRELPWAALTPCEEDAAGHDGGGRALGMFHVGDGGSLEERRVFGLAGGSAVPVLRDLST